MPFRLTFRTFIAAELFSFPFFFPSRTGRKEGRKEGSEGILKNVFTEQMIWIHSGVVIYHYTYCGCLTPH